MSLVDDIVSGRYKDQPAEILDKLRGLANDGNLTEAERQQRARVVLHGEVNKPAAIAQLKRIARETAPHAIRSTADRTDERTEVEDGAQLLDEILETLTRFVIFPSEEAAVAYTLWITATHAQPSWEHATRFVFKSPIKRCGKTRVQEIGRELIHRPLSTTNISVAALVRAIDEDDPPTLVLDEADTIFGKSKEAREGAEDLRGILNSGHSRGWPYIRWNMQARQSEECATFAMALLGGIGDMPDTIEDRAVVVAMRRRAPGEHVAPFRRRSVPQLHRLRERLHAWVISLDKLERDEPELPVEDRDADKWESLVVIADRAGGPWPNRARAACQVLCGQAGRDQDTAGERLLADLYGIFQADTTLDAITTEGILTELHALDEAPWGDWYGKPITARGIARLLHPFGIRSQNLVVGDTRPKGYSRADLQDAWARYTLNAAPAATAATAPAISAPTSINTGSGPVADTNSPIRYPTDQHEPIEVADGAEIAEDRAEPAVDGACEVCGQPRWRFFRHTVCDDHTDNITLDQAVT
jgi:hypothetical protein